MLPETARSAATTALAAQVGVRRQTILALEKGHYIPSTLLAFKIARVLAMRVDELFELMEEDDA